MTISESFGFRNIRIETSPVNLNYYRNTKLIPKPETNFGYLETSPKPIPIPKTNSDFKISSVQSVADIFFIYIDMYLFIYLFI